MIKSKTWIKDRNFELNTNDLVKLIRKKQNGYPNGLEIGKTYKILRLENQDIFIEIKKGEGGIPEIRKVNRFYFAPISEIRNELIKEIFEI